MLPPIGFVLVTFNAPEQTIHLCERLTAMFSAPPIALHHDFGQCDLDRKKLPANVRVVDSWYATRWGTFPVVEANLAALRLLCETADPDWVVSLSTADFPVKSAERILADLQTTPFDGFLDHRELRRPALKSSHVRDESRAFADPAWLEIAYNRYVATNVTPKSFIWRFPSLNRPRLLRGPLAERLFTPFRANFRPYGGDAWYTLNRKAAKVLSARNTQFDRLKAFHLKRNIPEESVYQTVLCNCPDLRLSPDNLRYTDWTEGGSSPRKLTHADIDLMMRSSAHFARKFPFDRDLLNAVELATGGVPSQM